ncbi:uncharacterized protein LOC119079411 [Bradysia coprophila]|uniref:uncharacterized protein LOC119079411 n=1 Tax=Bradysia coprophila TaxID=38358 RepID=UPI00187D8A85|nr:uncharacterized protein LOC119079411 [Bradysia coprophila]
MSCIPLIMTLLFMGLTLVHSDSPEVNVADGLNDEVRPLFGPTPALKPLDPVPGTNLFFNLPYKWFDETKPGCFVYWFSEHFKGILAISNQIAVMCNSDDQKWYNETDSDWIIERPSEDRSRLAGEIILRNAKTKQIIERVWSTDKTWLSIGGFRTLWNEIVHKQLADQTWKFITDDKDKNRVTLWHDGSTLSQVSYPNHREALFMKKGFQDGFPYSFAPSIVMELKITNLQFDEVPEDMIKKHTSQQALMDAIKIENNSPGTSSRLVQVTQIVKNEFSYGFKQSIKTAFKVSGSVGIPLVAAGEIENKFEVELGANQNWKSSTSKSVLMVYDVKVPAYTNVNVSGWCDIIKDVRMDFKATVQVYGKTQRVTQYDDIVHDVPATGDMIRKQLEYTGFEGDILETKSDCVVVRVKGEMTATVGVRGRLTLKGESYQMSETA